MANVANAQTVQQAAEECLKQGLAARPDVLEAHSESAQAHYDLQAVEAIAHGDLATALAVFPASEVRIAPVSQASLPDSLAETVEHATASAFEQRPRSHLAVRARPIGECKHQVTASAVLSVVQDRRRDGAAIPERIATSAPVDTHGGLNGQFHFNLSWPSRASFANLEAFAGFWQHAATWDIGFAQNDSVMREARLGKELL